MSGFISGSGGTDRSGETDSAQTDAEAVTADAAALDSSDITFTGSDTAESVTGNFTLPTSDSSGTTISWTSGNQIVQISGTSASLSPEDEQTDFGPYTVTVTATVAKGSESETKDIELTVYPPATTKIAASGDGITFKMLIVLGGLSFKTNDGDNTNGLDDSTASVTDSYWIADTEVTYELWSAVYDCATDAARGETSTRLAMPV